MSDWMEKWKREAVLEGMRSVELGEMLRGMGWELGGRGNKLNRKLAILYLEGYEVADEVVKKLKLGRVDGGIVAEDAEGVAEGERPLSLDVGVVGRIVGGGECGPEPMPLAEALRVVGDVARKSPFWVD